MPVSHAKRRMMPLAPGGRGSSSSNATREGEVMCCDSARAAAHAQRFEQPIQVGKKWSGASLSAPGA